jgi:predicted nucleotidyltransferase
MDNITKPTLTIPPLHKSVINHILNKILGNAHIDSIFLFGSCAKGIARLDSDIDLFVVTHTEVKDDNHDAFNVLYGSTDDIPLEQYISCDILTASKDEFQYDSTPLIRLIKREGVELRGLL